MSYILVTRCSTQGSSLDNPLKRLEDARALFRRFHCFSAPRLLRRPCRRLIPEVLVHLGFLRGLIYAADRGRPHGFQTYIHFMETPPRLACDPTGTQLYILGGRYRVTKNGIEG